MSSDVEAFDALCDERFDGWVEELRDFCTIPCETDQFPELDRGAQWIEQRINSDKSYVRARAILITLFKPAERLLFIAQSQINKGKAVG